MAKKESGKPAILALVDAAWGSQGTQGTGETSPSGGGGGGGTGKMYKTGRISEDPQQRSGSGSSPGRKGAYGRKIAKAPVVQRPPRKK